MAAATARETSDACILALPSPLAPGDLESVQPAHDTELFNRTAAAQSACQRHPIPLAVVGAPRTYRQLPRRAGALAFLQRQRSDHHPCSHRLLLLGVGDRPPRATAAHRRTPRPLVRHLGLSNAAATPGNLGQCLGVSRAQRARLRHLGLRQRTQQPHPAAGTPALHRSEQTRVQRYALLRAC